MNLSEYVQYVAGLDISELQKEQKELYKKLELVKTILSMKEPDGIIPDPTEPLTSKAVITKNDLRYGLMRFSSGSPIAQALVKGSTITVEYKGQKFECSVPKLENYPTQKGRINGMKKLYEQFPEFTEGCTIIAELSALDTAIKIIDIL